MYRRLCFFLFVLLVQCIQVSGKRVQQSGKLLQGTTNNSLSSELLGVLAIYVC
jgi:hypothetical protein